ncbi:uncharacterized protein LOC141556166 [Sminthopsis crassicaudata]|uniref:uncharacterized protein LOC141556166 n=1 Tax=Sminthopsis crassicaudata TaxID=9301 RepID=UPI003D695EE1
MKAELDQESTHRRNQEEVKMKEVEEDGSHCEMPEKFLRNHQRSRGQRWRKRKERLQQQILEKKLYKRGHRGAQKNATSRAKWRLITGLMDLWKHQEQIDSALLARMVQTTEVLQVVVHQQALMLRYMRMQCHYKYYPVCVTPVPFNSTLYQYLEDVLKNATYATNATSELRALDFIISAMQNASITFTKEWNEEISKKFTSWFKGISLTDFFHWLTIGFIGVILLMLMFCLLSCVFSIFLKATRAALEALKADILNPIKNKKGEL